MAQNPRRLLIGLVIGFVLGTLIGIGGTYAFVTPQHQAEVQQMQNQIKGIRDVLGKLERPSYNVDVPPASSIQRTGATCQLHSINDDYQTTIVFRNNGERTVVLNWLNYDGKEEYYADLQPLDVLVQPTYVTHPWCIRDKSNGIILSVTAVETPTMVLIQ